MAELGNGKRLELPRSACVTEGERILLNSRAAYVQCHDGVAQILPSYVAMDSVDLGSIRLELVIKEITTADELSSFESLANYHYRDQPLFGRTARLIVQTFHPSYPKTIGYIELATPFYMSKSRTDLFNRPFSNGPTFWTNWDKDTARKYINLVVRIARCVVYPEFRGIGLGQKLLFHAREFAKKRWQVGGLKPQFIEISADMLKFVPFADRAGLHFIGETQGNLGRVAKDLHYLLQNRKRVKSKQIVKEEAFGIVDQQVARLARAMTIMKDNGWTAAELIERLRRIEKSASLRDLDLLQSVLSRPKPTYLGGLNFVAERFVRSAVNIIKPTNGFHKDLDPIEPLSGPIQVRKLTICHRSHVKRSKHTAAVQRAFGISPEEINHDIVDNISFSIAPGQVGMIVGPSGSGKTSLLRVLRTLGHRQKEHDIAAPRDVRLGTFEPIRSQKALIEALGVSDVSKALRLMGMVSLSDAFVYLKRYDELSAGQQYRAMLARLISSNSNVWLADEFCTNLDPIAANSVAARLGELAREFKAVLIVATPQPELVARSLKPDVVIRLTTAWDHQIVSGKEYIEQLGPSASTYKAPRVEFDSATFRRIANSVKPFTLLLPNAKVYLPGPMVINRGRKSALINVLSNHRTTLSDIPLGDLRKAGFASRKKALSYLRRRRGGFSFDSPVTLIEAVLLG
jgi:ABC-type ATPase with predicted acetyltransferase domain